MTWPNEWMKTGREPDFASKPWFKSLHAVSKEFCDLALHEKIVGGVKAILGENVILWGSTFVVRRPDEKHRWHIDVEHLAWEGVTVFFGVERRTAKAIQPEIHQSFRANSGIDQPGRVPDRQLGSRACAKIQAGLQARISAHDGR